MVAVMEDKSRRVELLNTLDLRYGFNLGNADPNDPDFIELRKLLGYQKKDHSRDKPRKIHSKYTTTLPTIYRYIEKADTYGWTAIHTSEMLKEKEGVLISASSLRYYATKANKHFKNDRKPRGITHYGHKL
jgi:hypothetical protein